MRAGLRRLAQACAGCEPVSVSRLDDASGLDHAFCLIVIAQVSSYMRAVLRTIAQCHSQRILHRDVKPGNFMLLSDSSKAPLKAIGELDCM